LLESGLRFLTILVTGGHFNNCLQAQCMKAIFLETMTRISPNAPPEIRTMNIQYRNQKSLLIQQFPAKQVRKR